MHSRRPVAVLPSPPLDRGANGLRRDDGRVAVLVDCSSPVPPVAGIDGVETDLVISAEADDEWLLDEVVEIFERISGPPELSETPAAG